MRKHIPHPVTQHSSLYPELHILHGGDESSAIEESLVVARDLRNVLREGEHILHVNMLVSPQRLNYIMGKRFDHGSRRGRNLFISYEAADFINKLGNIKAVIDARGVRYLVLTGFELAVLSSRHRAEFMAWIRMMRNTGVNVILFTMSCPGKLGALGALRYSARTINEVGAYLKQDAEEFVGFAETSTREEATQQPILEEQVSEEASIEADDESSFADMPSTSRIYSGRTRITKDIAELQHSDTDSLKTKDLALEMV